jgi:hypothetical protein
VTEPVAPAPATPAPTVTVRLADGRVGDVPADQADAVAAGGGAVLTSADVAKADAQREFGGVGGAAQAAGFGLLRGASLGLSDPIITNLADVAGVGPEGGAGLAQYAREQLAGFRDVNPVASTVGELAGFVTPGMGTLAGQAGHAAERGIAGLLGKEATSAAGRIAQRVVAGAGGSAAEGAIYGLGSALSEDALGDHDLTAEKLFAGAGTGALLGGIFGGTLGAGGQTGRELARAGGEGLASVARVTRSAGEAAIDAARQGAETLVGAGKSVLERVPGGRSLLAGDLQGVTDEMRSYLDTAAGQLAARTNEPAVKSALERVYREGKLNAQAQEEILDGATREVVKAAKAPLDAERTVYEVGLEQKGEHFAPLIDKTKRLAQRDAALQVWQDGRQFLDFWKETASKGGAEGGLKKFGKVFKDFEDEIGDAVSKGSMVKDPERVMMLLDQLKRDAGHGAQFGRNPWERAEAASGKNMPSFETFYNKTRAILEDESVWGPAAAAQKDWNAGHTLALGTRDSFGRWFVEKYGAKAGEPLFELDPAAVKGFLADINGSGTDLKARAFTDFGAGLRAKMDAIERHATLSPAQKASFDSARRGLDEMDRAFAKASDEARYVATVRKLRAGEGERGLLDSAAPIAGSLIAGPIGAAGGLASNLAIDAVTRPLTTAERLRSMRVATEKFDTLVREGVRGVFGGAGPSRPRLPRSKVEEVMREVRQLGANTSALVERVGRSFGHVNDAAPKVATAIGSTAQRAVAFLSAKAPREAVEPASLTPHLSKTPRLSDSEVATFARYLDATIDPASVLADMRHGAISQESVEALRVVYPRVYQDIREEFMTQLATRDRELPYSQRLLLWGLFDIPGDVTMTPDFLSAMQSAQDSQAPSAPPPGAQGAPKNPSGRQSSKSVAKTYATQSQRLEAS